MRRRTTVLLLSILLLASGVTAVHLLDQPNETEEPNDVSVQNGNLSIDEDEIFAEVEQMMDSDVEPPTIVLFSDETDGYERSFGGKSADFHRLLMQVDSSALAEKGTAGAYYLADEHTVYLWSGYASGELNRSERRKLTTILVEEYVHAVQYRTDSFAWGKPDSEDDPTDELMAWQAVKEGGDVYVASEYADERFPADQNLSAETKGVYSNSSGIQQYFLAPYYFGDRHIRSRIDSPSGIWSVYSIPPKTTEQLLHPRTKANEPVEDLTVQAYTNERFVHGSSDRQGELFVRLVLSQRLSRENATRAAAGWGNDRLVKLWQGGVKNYAWVLRWDSETDATEFETAFERYRTRSGTPTKRSGTDGETRFRMKRVSNETVVAFIGIDEFVTNVTAEAQNGTVSIGATASNETTSETTTRIE